MSHIFISYSRKDSDKAQTLEIKLQEEDFDVWIDGKIRVGDIWENEILKAIKECRIFVVLMSDHSRESLYVNREINHAIRLEKQIMPVLLQGSPFPKLKKYHYENMTERIRLSPKFVATIKRKFESPQKSIASLEYYVEELEKSLAGLLERPMIAKIIRYEKQRDQLFESIKENLTPGQALIDIHNLEKIEEIFEEWEELLEEIPEYAEQIEEEFEEIKSSIGDLQATWSEVWQEDPFATQLPTDPINYPQSYGGNLFEDP